MKQYSFLVPNRKKLSYQLLAYGILILNGLAYFFYGLKEKGHYGYLFLLGVLLLIIGFNYRKYKNSKQLDSLGIWLLLPAVLWVLAMAFWPALLAIICWGLYRISMRPLRISFNAEGIRYPAFPTRFFSWSSVKHVILKDDMLTIELDDDHFYQHGVTSESIIVDEAEFNEFCRQHLKS